MLTRVKCACGASGFLAFEDDGGGHPLPRFCPFCSQPLPVVRRRCVVCGGLLTSSRRDYCDRCAPELELGR